MWRYFIGDKESSEVVVFLECIDDGCEGSVLTICPLRIGFFDLSVEGVNVKKQVNSIIRERFHAWIVIASWINVVCYLLVTIEIEHTSNGITAKSFHECSIELTLSFIKKGVIRTTLVGHP
jgi:hypothetical protein